MKMLRNICFTLFLGVLTFSCEKEIVAPEQTPSVQGSCVNGLTPPLAQCGTSDFTSVIDASGTVQGSIELANDADELYVLVDMNFGRFIDEIKVFAGDANTVDNDGGIVVMENFQVQSVFATPQTELTVTIPHDNFGACADVIVWARVSTRNYFGQVTGRMDVWIDGFTFHNLEKFKYCLGSCTANIAGQASSN